MDGRRRALSSSSEENEEGLTVERPLDQIFDLLLIRKFLETLIKSQPWAAEF